MNLKKMSSSPNENNNPLSRSSMQKQKPPDKVLETFNLSDYKSCNRCTYFQFGDIAIEQNAYCCEICDPNKMEFICEECFNTCHKSCRNEEEETSNIFSQVKRKFFCECGLKKHQIEKQKDQELIKACLFGEVDINMGFDIKCFCKTCKMYICYICSKECHKQKNGCELHKGKIRYYNYEKGQNSNENACQCKAPRHSNKNSMIRIINKFIDKEEFGEMQHIWRLQLFNNFCTTQIFNSLFMETQTIINNFTLTTHLRRDYFNLCDKFVRLGKLILKSQKYFYFKESYANLISYKNIIKVITSFKFGQYEKFGNYICSLCFFLYFVHLKKDFQKIKGLCVIDYFISNPIDRIFYRKLLYSETIYTSDIYEKYFDKNLKVYKIAEICNILLEVLDNAINDFTIKKLDKCLKNYFTILKICFFCLKRFLFDINSLIKFIDTYIKIALNIYHYVDYCIKEKKTGTEFEGFLETLMYYLTRINICLVFNYNDLKIESYMDENISKVKDNSLVNIEEEGKKKYFNYYSHETSKKLLRILIATSTMYGSFTLNTKNVNKTHLTQLNLLLETYILTNNSYSINLKSLLSPQKFINNYNRIRKIESLAKSISYIQNKKIAISKKDGAINEEIILNKLLDEESLKSNEFGNKKNEEYIFLKEMKKPEGEKDFELCLQRNIFNLKERIEMNFDKFFQYKIKIDKVMKDLVEGLKNFCENEGHILNKDYLEYPSYDELGSQTNKINKENKQFNFNTFLRERKIKKYQEKLKLMIQEKINFLSCKIFNSPSAIQDLIDELILSSFDTTISKIFFMDKSNKLLSQRDCNIVLYFLLIYCLTEDGLRNFCLGRNFRRIIKCFALHPKITLEFYFYVFKGIYLYGIDIKNHKKLSKIVSDLIDYLKKYEVNSAETELLFKEEFYYVSKIFVYLSKILDVDNLMQIKEDLCQVLYDKKIINQKKFGIVFPLYFIFSNDLDSPKNIDNNIRMISQRFKFTPNIYNKDKLDNDDLPKRNNMYNPYFESTDSNNEEKIILELKKELLAKYLVKEKEVALKAQKLIRLESRAKIETASLKKKMKKKDLDLTKDKTNVLFKDFRENQADYLEALEKGDLKKLIVWNEKFIFSFLDFISEVTFYVSRKNKTILKLLRLFDLNFLTFLLSRKYIKIKYRTIVIKFIHEIYLGEEIRNNELKTELYPNSEEYYQIMTKKQSVKIDDKKNKKIQININFDDNEENEEGEKDEEKIDKLGNYKLNNLNILKTYITFLIDELDIIIKVILEEEESDRIDLGLPYLNELIFGIKLTGDIFISNDITSYITLWFYELVKIFLCKSYFFKNFYESIKQNKKIENDYLVQENSNKAFYVYEGELIQKNFNIYNKELLFQKLLNEIYSFFKLTDFDDDFKISKIISIYRERNDKEFHVICLNNIKEGTSLLSEEENKNKETKNNKIRSTFEIFHKNVENIINFYFQDFIFLPNIVLINLIFTKSDDIRIEYRNIFLEYALEIFYHCNEISGTHANNLFTIMNKILFYNYNAIQISLRNKLNENNIKYQSRENIISNDSSEHKTYDETLFYNLQNLLKEKICLQLVTVKKCKLFQFFLDLCCETKNIIQFFQLLGEGHNKEFQTLIVNGKNMNNYNNNVNNIILKENKNCDSTLSVFRTLCRTLEKCLELINIYSEEETDGEMAYDKLILLTENIVQFIIEFFQGTGEALYVDMYKEIKNSLESIKKIIKLKIPDDIKNKRRNFIIVLKIILLDLLSSIIEEGISDLNYCQSLKDIMLIFEPVSLYEEIRLVMLSLYNNENINMKGISLENLDGVSKLIELYKFDENFQKSLELKLSLKIFYFLKILTDVYNREEVIELFKNFEKQYKEVDIYENVIKEINDSSKELPEVKNDIQAPKKTKESPVKENPVQKNYIQNKEIQNNEIPNNDEITNVELLSPETSQRQLHHKRKKRYHDLNDINVSESNVYLTSYNIQENEEGNINSNLSNLNKEGLSQTKTDYIIYLFLNQIMQRIQIKTEGTKMGRDFSFFVIPPLCLLLRSSTKNSFMENVDRDTVSTKILSLIEESDYFIYEMFYNKLTMKSFTFIDKKLFNLEFVKIEYINYLFIFLQNVLNVIHYFSKEPIEKADKQKRKMDVIALMIIHMIIICFTLFVFIKYKYKLKFKHEIMNSYKEKFIFRKSKDNPKLNESLSEEGFLNNVGNNLSLKQIIYAGFIRSILLNREINIFFFTFIFNILFLILPNCIFLSIPLLLVANINPLLLGIVVSFEIRLKQLLMVLIFMYLIVYLFSWIAFYYFPELFEFDNLLNVNKNEQKTEKLCSSMVQCYLTMLSYGVRSGGGIGDVLPKLSYKVNPGYFIAAFFFVVLFHILVIWIMINLFFGIIVDTFAALREKTYKIEEDKKNTCFICQITRDRAMNKNINFEKHIKNVHNIWNYVYFIAYLHINNEKNFKALETKVLEKIEDGDTSWLPIGEENCNSN